MDIPPGDLVNPKLTVTLLGYGGYYKGRHFTGEALVGYTIANESYVCMAQQLPPLAEIERLRPKLVRDLKTKLDFTADPSQLGLFLLFGWIQGED